MTISLIADADADWRSKLLKRPTGEPKPLLLNAVTAFRQAREWQGVLAHDLFAQMTYAVAPAPWDEREGFRRYLWTSQHDRQATLWLQKAGLPLRTELASQAIETVAAENAFHPVREYLATTEWDEVRRGPTWLTKYLGAEDTPYVRMVAERFLIAAVARVMRPGCKVDTVVILEGRQGIGKSSALRALFAEWFSDELADLGSKDAAMQTRGVWLIELSELDSMSRGDVSRIKAFISRNTDRFRPPYGARLVESPRQCIFAGTTNSNSYLRDETGGRRFWPIVVHRVDLAGLQRDRDQLWAEAFCQFKAGQPWWLTDDETAAQAAGDEQRDRYAGDPWDDHIQAYLQQRDETSVPEILERVIRLPQQRWTQFEQNRVARVLQTMGFERRQVRREGTRQWRYFRHQPPS